MFTKLRQYLFSALERRLGSYITVHYRPIRSSEFGRSSFPTPTLPPYAVILRGIVVDKNDFTLETVKIYTRLFPNAPIIISTWKDAPADTLAALAKIPNVHIVLPDHPAFAGYGHINYQIGCSVAGLQKAKELGAAYVIHTRTDQRINATDMYPYLYGLTESFPLEAGGVQQKRIIALSINTLKYRTYGLNDMFFFGTTEDVTLYWDIPHDTRTIAKVRTVGEWVKNKVCEGYLFTTFLTKVGHNMQDTLADYWEALGKYFILIDTADLDWYWIKYARFQEYRDRQYAGYTLGEHVGFKDWLIMNRDYEDTRTPKNYDNLPNDTHNTKIELE